MKWNPISRRHFLQGSGTAMLAIPFLSSLVPRAFAATSRPKNFLHYCLWHGGARQENFFPKGADPRTAAGVIQSLRDGDSGHKIHSLPLSMAKDGSGNLSPILSSRWAPHFSKMNLYQGIDTSCLISHNQATLGNYYTGNFGGDKYGGHVQTIDNMIAFSKPFNEGHAAPKYRVVNGSRYSEDIGSYQYEFPESTTNKGKIIKSPSLAWGGPSDAWNMLFSNFSAPPTTTTPNRKKKIVDLVLEDATRTLAGNQISSNDRLKLDQYLQHLSDLEGRLDTGGAVACTVPAKPPGNGSTSYDGGAAAQRKLAKDYTDIFIAAFVCGLTRVASYYPNQNNLCGYVNDYIPWHDGTAHIWEQAAAQARLVDGYQYYFNEMILYAVEQLEAFGIMDDTLILASFENVDDHNNWSTPAVTIGNPTGNLNTGLYLDYVNHESNNKGYGYYKTGIFSNRLMISLMQAFGLGASDYETTPGTGQYNTTPLDPAGSMYNGTNPYSSQVQFAKNPLPFLMKS